jgi:UDP-N-acetylmuramate--alanine ligase
MIAKILIDAKLDPTVIVGSLLNPSASSGQVTNFIAGKSKYIVVEADEYRNAFHNLEPSIFVINNIDADHLDFFKDLDDIRKSFRVAAEKVPKNGFVVCNMNDEHIIPVVSGLPCTVVNYAEYKKDIPKLKIPGDHNRSNAAAAFAVALFLGVSPSTALGALRDFSGTWRRFEYKGKMKCGALVYDDYAHNPQKVRAALQGAREIFRDRRIIAVFMPHLYSRTKLLLNDFAESFGDADEVIVSDIFPAREPYDPSITSEMLVNAVKKFQPNTQLILTFEEIETYLRGHAERGDVIITIGAGDVYKVGEALLGR